MTSAPRRRFRTAVIGLTSLAVAGVGTVALTGPAIADPNDLTSVRDRMEQVSTQVDELYHQAEVANERYLRAQEQHAAAAEQLAAAQAAVERQKQKVADMTASMGGFAAAAYRQGVVDPTLQLVLSENPDQALQESVMMDAFADQQSAALAHVAGERTALAQRQAGVEEQATLLQQLESDMVDQKISVESRTKDAEALLASLKGREREILAEVEAERQREIAARAASRDQNRQAPTATGEQSATGAQSASPAQPAPEPPPVAASGRGAAAAAFAIAQIGDAYVAGGTGPNAWDCSGLTQGSWRAAGVAVPRTSQSQYYGLPRVSLNALQPGDIVAYYGGISHVGIYIGNGQIVHSSRPGRPVSIAPLHSMPVMGAVRPG